MLRTLRSRLIFSHILPLIIVVPVMYLALVYFLETRFLMPRLTGELLDNARYLTALAQAESIFLGDVDGFSKTLKRLDFPPGMRVILLGPESNVAYTNDPDYLDRLDPGLVAPALIQAWAGDEVVLSHYSFFRRYDDLIQVMAPVKDLRGQVTGVLWMTYYAASMNELFGQLRSLSIAIVIISLVLGTALGSVLAVNISKPVGQVTQAIQGLARGERSEQLAVQGPEEVRDLVRSVNYLVERLQSLEQSRRQLLANLVHELGRPLGALRSAIQALAQGAAHDPQLLQDLTTGMDEETARLQRLLEDLAHLHDQGLGTLELKREAILLSEWLPRTLVPWQEAALAKKLIWNTNIPPDLPTVQIDPVRFAQVVGNLLSNAIKYTPAGQPVTVEAGVLGEEIWIKVKDGGPGIAVEEQQKIFQPFYRGGQGRRIKQGMGLGLSIARDLVVAHRGQLDLESAPGMGSTFTVWMPMD
jgi:signal transduction histidine kinase